MEEEIGILEMFLDNTNFYQAVALQLETVSQSIDSDLIQVLNEIETCNINLLNNSIHISNFSECLYQCSNEQFHNHFRMSKATMQVC